MKTYDVSYESGCGGFRMVGSYEQVSEKANKRNKYSEAVTIAEAPPADYTLAKEAAAAEAMKYGLPAVPRHLQ